MSFTVDTTLTSMLQAAAYGDESDLVLFTGEMVFPWMFEDLAGLRPMKGVAELLAQRTGWSKLYDSERLQRNEVPVVAATYVEVRCWATFFRTPAAQMLCRVHDAVSLVGGGVNPTVQLFCIISMGYPCPL